jgi:hypothetical protein
MFMFGGAGKSSSEKESLGLGPKEVVVFCVLLATLHFVFRGYSYGIGNHIEQLPKLYRLLDVSFCSNDFSVNAGAAFGPRTYYLNFLGFLCSRVRPPVVFLVLAWLGSIGLAVVTYLAAKDLVEDSDLVGMIACVLVMGTTSTNLGGVGRLWMTYLLPGHLVYWVALLSLWAGMRGRGILCAVLGSVASVIHPLVGLEAGAIGLAMAGMTVFFCPAADRKVWKQGILKRAVVVGLGACILGAAAGILWAGRIAKTLDTKQFVDLVAHFRHPHHYIPSTWSVVSYLFTAFVLFSFALSWKWWRDGLGEKRYMAYRVLTVVFIVLLLWCGGYVFVEVYPSRLWTSAQTFRLAFVLNWVVFLVIARTVASMLRGSDGSGKVCGWLILLGSGSTLPIFAFFGHLVEFIRRRIRAIFPDEVKGSIVALLLLLGGVLLIKYGSMEESWAMMGFMATVVWFLAAGRRWYRVAVPALVLCVLLVGIFDMRHQIPVLRRVVSKVNPEISSTGQTYFVDEIAGRARMLTPETAVFLTPPMFGRFRLVARRAIVVDFQCFPFQDAAMVEWKRRLRDCYGEVE